MKNVAQMLHGKAGLLARWFSPLEEITDRPLTNCTLSDKVCSKAGVQEQEQLYVEYAQSELNFKNGSHG